MNTAKIQTILSAIDKADPIQVSDMDCVREITSHWTVEVQNDPNNQVLNLEWQDEDFQIFNVCFTEKSLSDAQIEENRIVLQDGDGTEFEIHLFNIVPAVIMPANINLIDIV